MHTAHINELPGPSVSNGFKLKVRACHGTAVPRCCAPPRRLLTLALTSSTPRDCPDRSHGEMTRPLPRAPTRRAAVTHSAPVPLLPPCRRTTDFSALPGAAAAFTLALLMVRRRDDR